MGYNPKSNLYQNSRYNTNVYTTETTGQTSFFTDYHSHSLQLVDALRQWVNKVKFTSCKYEQGFLEIDNQEPIESMNRGFMLYIKKHLENENSYKQQILDLIIEIETNHKDICQKIKELISSEIPYKPSFQRIITEKIKYSNPILSRTQSLKFEQNNTYIGMRVFKIIFGAVFRGESEIVLSIQSSNDNNCSLWYGNNLFGLAQGEATAMNRLSHVINELVHDEDIKKKVDEYTNLEKQLTNHEKIDELRDRIDDLWTFIDGGGYLGGFDTCQLCDRSKSAPTRI